MSNYLDMSGSRTADWLLQTLTRNPEGLLLLGAGCALLFRSGRSSQPSQPARTYRGFENEQREHAQSSAREWAQGASRVADSAREYVSSAGKAVSDTAAGYAAAAPEYAQGTGQQVLEQSRRMADQAQSTMQSVVRERPLAVALAGIAAGAAVAAAFPATRWERRNLGPAGRQISEAAQTAAQTARERITEATSAAGERLMGAAQQGGLNAEGLKQVAREVAGAVTGEQKSQHSAGTDRPASSQNTSGAQGSTTQSETSSSSRNDPNWSASNRPAQR
jgi:hypothetical protein